MTFPQIGSAALVIVILAAATLLIRRRRRPARTPLDIAKAASRAAAQETRRITKPNLRGEGSGDAHGDTRFSGGPGDSYG